MDPVSFASTAAGLVATCARIGDTLYQIYSDVKDIDDTVSTFRLEIVNMADALRSIESSFRDPVISQSILAKNTGYEAAHWKHVLKLLDDCKETLSELDGVLNGIQGGHGKSKRGKSMRKLREYINHNMKSGEIARLRMQIQSYRETLSISLHMITMSVLWFPSANDLLTIS
jgi:hypothetical protein